MLCGDCRQFWNPGFDVGAIWVLGHRRWSYSEVPLVQPGFASILPHHAVDRQVSINKGVVEPPAGGEVLRTLSVVLKLYAVQSEHARNSDALRVLKESECCHPPPTPNPPHSQSARGTAARLGTQCAVVKIAVPNNLIGSPTN